MNRALIIAKSTADHQVSLGDVVKLQQDTSCPELPFNRYDRRCSVKGNGNVTAHLWEKFAYMVETAF